MSNPEQRLDALLDLLYQAASDPAVWTEFLAATAGLFDACIAGLINQPAGGTTYAIAECTGMDGAGIRLYNEHYAVMDPWCLALQNKQITQWIGAGSELCPAVDFADCEYYVDFWRKHTRAWYQGGIIHTTAGAFSVLTLHRTRRRGDFDGRDLALLKELFPHLRRALAVHRTVIDLRSSLAQASGAIDALDIGLVGVSEDRKIRFVNARGEALLRDGNALSSRNGRLIIRDPGLQARLDRLLRTAFQRTLATPSGGATQVFYGAKRLMIAVLPAQQEIPGVARGEKTAVLLVFDPDAQPQSREHLLTVLFGLTPAESRVAMLLLQGLDPGEIAERIRTTAGTVRFHLKMIYRKTGVSRQSQLVRLISQLPGAASDGRFLPHGR